MGSRSAAAGDSGSTNDIIMELMKNLKDSDVSLITKYIRQNELKKIARSSKEALNSVKAALQQETGFVYKRLLLDSELEAYNVQYLVDLVISAEESILVKYALTKYHWLFKQDTPFNDPKFFVEKLLPKMPYTTRNLILWEISKNYQNQSKCEELYEAVDSLIGPSIANNLLPSCSLSFVSKVMQSPLNLTHRQLSWLLKKHPSSAIKYLKENAGSYPNMMRRIVSIDPHSFADIFEKTSNQHSIDNFISPATTKLLIKTCFNRILDKAKIYSQILHNLTLFKLVTEEVYIKFLIASLPSTVEDFQNCEYAIVPIFEDWIHCLPATVNKGQLFKNAFLQCYGTALIDCPSCISPSILKIFSSSDRDMFSDLKLAGLGVNPGISSSPVSVQKAQWIACKSIEKSIPALKVLIAQEADHFNRQQLLGYLIKACGINHDGMALNEVCKYYVDRHRNERQDTHARFISDITNEFDSKDLVLDQNALHYFVEIFKLYMMNLEKDSYIQISESLLEMIYFAQVDNCLSTSWILPILFKIKLNDIRSWRPNWTFSREEHLNQNYLTLIEILVERMETLPLKTLEDWTRFIIAVLSWCKDWNRNISPKKKNPNNKLPVNLNIKHFPNIEDKLLEVSEKIEEIPKHLVGPFVSAILQDSSLSQDPSSPIFVRCLELIPNELLIQHFLNHNIAILNSNWEIVSKCLFTRGSKYGPIAIRLKRNGYESHIAQINTEFDQRLMDNNIEGSEKIHIIGLASLTFSTELFLSWIQAYYPKASEASTSAHYPPETFLSFMAARKGICQYLRNMENPTLALPALIHFCVGDYLKLTLGSLFSIVLSSEFVAAEKFLLELCQRPAVSVKKHGIRLMAQISCTDGFCKFLMDLWAKDSHPTTRAVILSEILHRLDYDGLAWESLQDGIESLTPKDQESLLLVSTYDAVPVHLVEEYGSMIWRKYQEIEDQNLLSGFVRTWIFSYFDKISADWILRFIGEEPIFIEGETDDNHPLRPGPVRDALATLLVRSIFKFPEKRVEFLDVLNKNLEAVEPLLGNSSPQTVDSSFKMVFRFVKHLCQQSFDHDQKLGKEELLKLFEVVRSHNIFARSCPETFSSELFLNLTSKLHESSDGDRLDRSVSNGAICGHFLDESIAKHGSTVFTFWAKQFRTFIRDIWHPWWISGSQSENDFKLELAIGLMESSSENLDEKMIFVLTLLPETKPKSHDAGEKYETLVKKISASNSFLVQLHFMDWAIEIQK